MENQNNIPEIIDPLDDEFFPWTGQKINHFRVNVPFKMSKPVIFYNRKIKYMEEYLDENSSFSEIRILRFEYKKEMLYAVKENEAQRLQENSKSLTIEAIPFAATSRVNEGNGVFTSLWIRIKENTGLFHSEFVVTDYCPLEKINPYLSDSIGKSAVERETALKIIKNLGYRSYFNGLLKFIIASGLSFAVSRASEFSLYEEVECDIFSFIQEWAIINSILNNPITDGFLMENQYEFDKIFEAIEMEIHSYAENFLGEKRFETRKNPLTSELFVFDGFYKDFQDFNFQEYYNQERAKEIKYLH